MRAHRKRLGHFPASVGKAERMHCTLAAAALSRDRSQGRVQLPTGGMRPIVNEQFGREPASAFRKEGSADQVRCLGRRS